MAMNPDDQRHTNPFSREAERRHINDRSQKAPDINPSGPTAGTEFGGPDPTSTRPGREGGGNVRENEGRKYFRCADVGFADCRWETSGRSADQLMPDIERHGREAHNLSEADIARSRNKIRDAIHDRAA